MDEPVVPTRAMTSSTPTDSPFFTAMPWRWLYVVMRPLPWSISTRLPPPHGCHPTARTTPASAEYTRVPHGAAKSWPQWNSPAVPVSGLVRRPNGDDSVSVSSGAIRKPLGGRCRPADATRSSILPALDLVWTVVRAKDTIARRSTVSPAEPRPAPAGSADAPVPRSSNAGPGEPVASSGCDAARAASRAKGPAGAGGPKTSKARATPEAAARERATAREVLDCPLVEFPQCFPTM